MADGRPDAAAMTGLAFLQGIAQGTLPPAPIAELMDFRLCAAEAGRVVFEGRPAACHYNPIGTVHGGYAATLLDSAMGCAVHSVLEAGMGYTTLEIKVNLVRPLTGETGPVRAEGTPRAPRPAHRDLRGPPDRRRRQAPGARHLHLPAVSSVTAGQMRAAAAPRCTVLVANGVPATLAISRRSAVIKGASSASLRAR